MWNFFQNGLQTRFVTPVRTIYSCNNDINKHHSYYLPIEVLGSVVMRNLRVFSRQRHHCSVTSSMTKSSYIRYRLDTFSTQAQIDDNTSHSGSIGTEINNTGDEDVHVDDDDDDDFAGDGETDRDDTLSNINKSETNSSGTNIDEYLSRINVDDLELPPNPDIPPPKVRTPYPIATPQSSQNRNKTNHKSKSNSHDTPSVLANERLVAKIMFNMKQRQNKANTKSGGSNSQAQQQQNGHHNQHSSRNQMTGHDIQVRVVPDPLLAKVNKPVVETKKQTVETKKGDHSAMDDHDEHKNDDETSATTVSDTAGTNKPKTMVVALSVAIQMSIDQGKDLIEISIDQEVPVVTISNVKGLAYQSAKSKKTIKIANAASSQVKEVTMFAGIATNDLQRKVNDVLKFLEKGYMCIVTIRINRRQNRENSNAPENAIKRILPLLSDDKVEMVVPPEINPLRTMASFRVRGKKEINKKK